MFPRSSTAALAGLLAVLAPAIASADPAPSVTPPAAPPAATTPASTTPGSPVSTTPVSTTPATPAPTGPSTPASPATPGTTESEEEPIEAQASRQLLVRFRSTTPSAARLALIKQAGGTLEAALPLDDVALVGMGGSVTAGVHWLLDQSQVVWAEPNATVHAATELTYRQGDPYFTKQWGIENFGNEGRLFDADIDAVASWYVTKGAEATVGVVDTGVDASHPDLAGQLLPGVNFMPDGHATTADGSGHGTHVTGTIAALENEIGIVGAAPAAKVVPLRALDDTGAGTSATIASAFAHAGKEGMRIVNASLGASAPSKAVADAIAASPNTLFVVAAGNAGVNVDNGGGANYPCQYDLPNILCVGASDDRDQPAAFSNRGTTSVDLSAPGVGIISTAPGNTYRYESGTSMATPFATAVAAQVLRVNPGWTAAQLRTQLMQTVDQPASLRGVSMTGGRLNAARAVGLYAGPDGLKPATVTGLVGTAGVGSAALSWQPAASLDLAIYQVEVLQGGSWTQKTYTFGETETTITGLTPGVPVTYRVRGIDKSGEEGDPSNVVTVVPTADAAKNAVASGDATTKSTKAATKSPTKSTGGPDAGSTAGAVASSATLSAVKRAKAKGKVKAVSFRLSASSQVTITAVPVRKGAGAQSVISKTFSLAAGIRAVKFGSGTPALRLKKGTWKITLATKASRVSLKVVIR